MNAWLWLGVVALIFVHQIHFWRAPCINSDVLALRQMLQQTNQRVVIFGGTKNWRQTQAAADVIVLELAKTPAPLKLSSTGSQSLARAIEFYRP